MKKYLYFLLSACCLSVLSAPVRSNLGGEGEEYIDTAVPTAADYLQDGLVAHWDGIENVGYGLHDDSVTAWTDLSGNGFDLSLNAYAMSNNRLLWKSSGLWHCGNNYDVRCPFTALELLGSEGNHPFTFSQVFYVERQCDYPLYAPFTFQNRLLGLSYRGLNVSVSFPWPYANNLLPVQGFEGYEFCVSVVWDGEYGMVHVNDMSSLSKSGDPDQMAQMLDKPPLIFHSPGYNPTVENSWICELRNVRVYNRALSPAEIAYNHKIDRLRFNLP